MAIQGKPRDEDDGYDVSFEVTVIYRTTIQVPHQTLADARQAAEHIAKRGATMGGGAIVDLKLVEAKKRKRPCGSPKGGK